MTGHQGALRSNLRLLKRVMSAIDLVITVWHALRKSRSDPLYGFWFYRFYCNHQCNAFADPLAKLSKIFVPETDAAIDELILFKVDV